MLVLAYDHKDEVEGLYSDLMRQDRFKWMSSSPIFNRPDWEKLNSFNYEKQMYLSVKKDDEETSTMLGIIEYNIDHWRQSIAGFSCIRVDDNDDDNGYIFMKDMLQVVFEIFHKYGFRKLNWCVIVGNPVEASWDKFCKLAGGRVVGTFKDDAYTSDRVFRDVKHYEVLKDDFYKTNLFKHCVKVFEENLN